MAITLSTNVMATTRSCKEPPNRGGQRRATAWVSVVAAGKVGALAVLSASGESAASGVLTSSAALGASGALFLLGTRTRAISNPAHGQDDLGIFRIAFDFCAQALNMNVY